MAYEMGRIFNVIVDLQVMSIDNLLDDYPRFSDYNKLWKNDTIVPIIPPPSNVTNVTNKTLNHTNFNFSKIFTPAFLSLLTPSGLINFTIAAINGTKMYDITNLQ